jgi:ribonuclease P protein component
MSTKQETFDKSERLCSKKIISGLFENGNAFYSNIFKVVWGISPVALSVPAQIMFSVSKRGFKLAVTRNLIKRRMREAYRKNKYILYEQLTSRNIQLVFVVMIIGNVVPDYPAIEKSMKEIINTLIFKIKRNGEIC